MVLSEGVTFRPSIQITAKCPLKGHTHLNKPAAFNFLPQQIKLVENLIILKRIIKQWNGTQCKCPLCQNKFHH